MSRTIWTRLSNSSLASRLETCACTGARLMCTRSDDDTDADAIATRRLGAAELC